MAIAQEQFTNAQISLFFDPIYVDTEPNQNSPPYNIQQFLDATTHTVTTFAGTDTAAWREATENANVLIIPSLDDIGDTVPETQLPLSAGAMFFLKDFVSRGGTLIVTGEIGNAQHGTDLIDAVFDTALNEQSTNPVFPSSDRTASAAGTVYANGGTPLPGSDAVEFLAAASLPTFATSLYETALGDSTVAAFQYGKGQVIWLGWDWNNARPVGAQDGGWNDILLRSLSATDGQPNGVVIEGKKGNDKVNSSTKSFPSTDRDDVIALGKGNDKAFAGGGHDVIDGDSGKDKLHGGEGDDTIVGGKNRDKLWGDPGGDYFLFDQKPSARHADQIKDFIDGIDLILLDQGKFTGLAVGDMSSAQFLAHVDYTANGWLLYDGKKFAKLVPGLAISEADFLVV